jgi:hypothetical protein
VNCRGAVFLAFVVYVTLDLAMPDIPGAFVFDPADTIESARLDPARDAAVVVAVRAARESTAALAPCVDVPSRAALFREVARRERPVARWRLRTILFASPPGEDPH